MTGARPVSTQRSKSNLRPLQGPTGRQMDRLLIDDLFHVAKASVFFPHTPSTLPPSRRLNYSHRIGAPGVPVVTGLSSPLRIKPYRPTLHLVSGQSTVAAAQPHRNGQKWREISAENHDEYPLIEGSFDVAKRPKPDVIISFLFHTTIDANGNARPYISLGGKELNCE